MRQQGLIVLKSADEVAKIRRAGRLAAAVLREVVEAVAPGLATEELDRLAESRIRDAGAVPSFKNYRGYPSSICVSIDDEVVHGIPGKRRLREGMIVSIDLGVLLDGFHADLATTVPIGEVPSEARRLLAATADALASGIAAVRPGSHLGDIGAAIQEVIEGAGFSPVREFAGHGIGRDLHEDPRVPNVGRRGAGVVLRPGMTLAIEPMANMGRSEVWVDGDGWTVRTRDRSPSAHEEHTVAIIEGGVEVLTLDGEAAPHYTE